MAKALAAAHAAGIAHRDIKPENILVRDDGSVKVLDFGLARLAPAHLSEDDATVAQQTMPGHVMGTLKYMSPQQARGAAAGPPSDIFSLDLVFDELVSGKYPLKAETTVGYLHAITVEEPLPVTKSNPDIPAAFEALISRMLAKEAAKRPTASEVDEALAAIEQGKLVEHMIGGGDKHSAPGASGAETGSSASMADSIAKGFQKQVAEQTAGGLHGQQVPAAAVQPAIMIGGQAGRPSSPPPPPRLPRARAAVTPPCAASGSIRSSAVQCPALVTLAPHPPSGPIASRSASTLALCFSLNTYAIPRCSAAAITRSVPQLQGTAISGFSSHTSSVPRWWQTIDLLEFTQEVTAIHHAHSEQNILHRQGGGSDKVFRLSDASVLQVTGRRNPHFSAEQPVKMGQAKPCVVSQIGHI